MTEKDLVTKIQHSEDDVVVEIRHMIEKDLVTKIEPFEEDLFSWKASIVNYEKYLFENKILFSLLFILQSCNKSYSYFGSWGLKVVFKVSRSGDHRTIKAILIMTYF